MFHPQRFTVGRHGNSVSHFKGGAKSQGRASAALQQQAYDDQKAAAAEAADHPQGAMASPEGGTTRDAANASVSANRKGRNALVIDKSSDAGSGSLNIPA